MFDLEYVISENMYAFKEQKACPKSVCNAILNGVAMLETETVVQYTKAMNALTEVCKDDPQLCEAVTKMMQKIIEDETNHDASVKKAAALFMGMKAPKPSEYQEAKHEG